MSSAIELKLFSGIHLLLKVFHFEAFVNRITGNNKSTSRCDFRQEIFYRLLSAINSNVDFIVNSIYNKIFMQSSENIFIGSYWQLITLVLLSILLIFNIIKHSCRVQGYNNYIFLWHLSAIISNVKVQDKYFYRLMFKRTYIYF